MGSSIDHINLLDYMDTSDIEQTVPELFETSKKRGLSEKELKLAFPCLFTKLVPTSKIQYNDYNPNSVAPPEMRLLRHSIEQDGYTQPIVAIYDNQQDVYVVIDGAHRYKIAKKLGLPYIPLVSLDKNDKERIASTIRHNRARGEHGVERMSNIVIELFKLGWEDKQISEHLGMDADEVLRLKQITGLAEMFGDREFSEAWEYEQK